MEKKLVCFSQSVHELAGSEKRSMYLLFCNYYNNVSLDQFYKDLSKKDYVFLLRDKVTLDIKGFSTIAERNVEINGKNIRGYFSGDTVIDKDYWGQGALGVSFLKFLFKQRMKKPFSPLYWFLASKGYKTYLLMANNFKDHYPRFEKSTPKYEQRILNSFGKELYGKSYDLSKGVISYSSQGLKTKGDITPITKEMLLKNPRIKYFSDLNPGWENGEELACIAKMTFTMPFYYQFKTMIKRMNRRKSALMDTPITEAQGSVTLD